MNVYGVAREVRPSTACRCDARHDGGGDGSAAAEALDVVIEAPDLCGRSARASSTSSGPSPAWLRDRLELVGIRSISNLGTSRTT